jgi:ribose transport system ATP-binding protein
MLLTATENLTIVDLKPFWKRGWLRDRGLATEVRQWFDRLEVRPVDGTKLPLGSFSGGNQQKVILGKWLRVDPKVLLLDEPTQGVDVGAKAELHRQIVKVSEQGAAVIISSTDVEELATLCDPVLIMRDGRVTDVLTGTDVNVKNINASSLSAAVRTEGA